MQPRKRYFYPALTILLTACGGGGGGGGGGGDAVAPPPPPPAPDKYEASSYSSDGTSNQSLTGLWMMVEDNRTKATSTSLLGSTIFDVTRQRRSLINITDHGNGSATIVHCIDTGGVAQSTVPVSGSTLQFFVDGLTLQATIVNNQRLQGQMVSADASIQVLGSTVTVIKIDDSGSLPSGDPVGSVSAQVTDSGAPLHDFTDRPIHCFSQERYESERTMSGVVERFEGNYVEFTSLLNTPTDLNTASYLGSAIYYDGTASTTSPDVELYVFAPPFARYGNEQDPTVKVTTDTLEQVTGSIAFKDETQTNIAADVQFDIKL